jgi:hypothetical protein
MVQNFNKNNDFQTILINSKKTLKNNGLVVISNGNPHNESPFQMTTKNLIKLLPVDNSSFSHSPFGKFHKLPYLSKF